MGATLLPLPLPLPLPLCINVSVHARACNLTHLPLPLPLPPPPTVVVVVVVVFVVAAVAVVAVGYWLAGIGTPSTPSLHPIMPQHRRERSTAVPQHRSAGAGPPWGPDASHVGMMR